MPFSLDSRSESPHATANSTWYRACSHCGRRLDHGSFCRLQDACRPLCRSQRTAGLEEPTTKSKRERSQRLWTVLSENNSSSEEALRLQLAFEEVFGELDPREIAFGRKRQNPLRFFRVRRFGGKLVSFDNETTKYVDARSFLSRRIPLVEAGRGVFFSATPAFFIFLLYAIWAEGDGLSVQLMALFDSLAVPFLLCVASARLGAASQMLNEIRLTHESSAISQNLRPLQFESPPVTGRNKSAKRRRRAKKRSSSVAHGRRLVESPHLDQMILAKIGYDTLRDVAPSDESVVTNAG